MTERQRGVGAWRRGIEEILTQEVAQRAEALNAEMVREIEEQEAEKEEAEQAARMAAARRAEREQEADASHHLDVELLKRPLRGLAEEYRRRFPSASNPPATAPGDNMTLDDIEVKSGRTVRDERSKGKNKGKHKTKMRAKPQQSEEEYYTTCEDRTSPTSGVEPRSSWAPLRQEGNPKAIRAQMGVRRTPRVEDREDPPKEDREATPTSPMTACVSECFPDTHAQGDYIEINYTIESPKTSSTDCQPLIGSSEEWKNWRRSPSSSGRKQPSPSKRWSDSLVWLLTPKEPLHKQWKNGSATRKSPPRCKIASMRSPPTG